MSKQRRPMNFMKMKKDYDFVLAAFAAIMLTLVGVLFFFSDSPRSTVTNGASSEIHAAAPAQDEQIDAQQVQSSDAKSNDDNVKFLINIGTSAK